MRRAYIFAISYLFWAQNMTKLLLWLGNWSRV